MDTNRDQVTCGLKASTSEGMGPGDPITRCLRLIRFSHTIFALPFALGALVVAANGWPSLRILVLVVACMIFARTAAMLFNRLVDWSLDQRNPRTASRHLLISKSGAIVLLAVSSGCFLVAAAAINRLILILAPVVLAAGVICWVAGFDLIYATQDYDFDRREDIRSLVVKLGIARSLRLAQLLHLLTFVALIAFGMVAQLGPVYYWSLPLIAAALVYEHGTEKRDLAGINRAFFQSNAFVSAVFLLAVCVDRLT